MEDIGEEFVAVAKGSSVHGGAVLDRDRVDDVSGMSDDDGVEDESAEEGDVGGLLRLFGNDCGPDPDL